MILSYLLPLYCKTVRKTKQLHNDGNKYIFSPYYLVWNGDNYYVVGFSDKHNNIGSFRVDRIKGQPDILNETAVPMPDNFEINDYVNTMYHMYDGNRQEVELKCDNSVVDSIIDRFGEDIPITHIDDSPFQIKTSIAVNHVFYSWVFGFGGKISITSPATVREQYLEMVLAAEESTKL